MLVSRADPAVLRARLAALAAHGVPDLAAVASEVSAIADGRYDSLIAPAVLRRFWAASMVGVAGSLPVTAGLLGGLLGGADGDRDLVAAERRDGPGGVVEPGGRAPGGAPAGG